MVSTLAALDGAGTALIAQDGTPITVGELDDRSNRLLDVLRSLGVAASDHIVVVTGNDPAFFEACVACGHGGIRFVPVNWHWTADEVAYVVEDSGARVAIVAERFVDRLDGVRSRGLLPDAAILVVGDDRTSGSYDVALAAADPAPPTEESMGGPMFYTSGTTGHPKGVKTSGRAPDAPVAWAATAAGLLAGLRMPRGGTQLLCGPVYHSAQWSWTVPLVFAGNTVVLHDGFDPALVLHDIDRYGVTGVHLVPTQFVRLLALDDDVRDAFDGSSLAAVWHGAAPCPPAVKHRMIDWFGPVIWEYYGGTEAGVLSVVGSEDWLARPGTVGPVSPGYEVEITDDDGAPVSPGEAGTIWFRRANGTRFEYHNAPEKTAAAHRGEGWATLGDVGSFDADGYLRLSDRVIDMIISGGVNIYPAEIEHCLLEHPWIVDAAVFGVPDDEFGEQVKAAIELVDGAAGGEALVADLDRFVRDRIAGYKAPRSYDVVDALPRMASGKLRKRELRAPYWADTTD